MARSADDVHEVHDVDNDEAQATNRKRVNGTRRGRNHANVDDVRREVVNVDDDVNIDERAAGNNNNNNHNTAAAQRAVHQLVQPQLTGDAVSHFTLWACNEVEMFLTARAETKTSSKTSFSESDLRVLLGLFAEWPHASNVDICNKYNDKMEEKRRVAARDAHAIDNNKGSIAVSTVRDRKIKWDSLTADKKAAILKGGPLDDFFVMTRSGAAHLLTQQEADGVCKAVKVIREKGWTVSTRMVQQFAKIMLHKYRPLDFAIHGSTFSPSWAHDFMHAHNFRLAAPTTDRTVPLETIERDGKEFYKMLREFRLQYNFRKDLVFNMDEFFVTIDTAGRAT